MNDVVREFMLEGGDEPAALAALDRLVADREADRRRWASTNHLYGQALTRAEAAEAALAAAKQAWWDQRNQWAVATGKNMDVMAALEAERDRLRAALRRVELWPVDVSRYASVELAQIKEFARAALDGKP